MRAKKKFFGSDRKKMVPEILNSTNRKMNGQSFSFSAEFHFPRKKFADRKMDGKFTDRKIEGKFSEWNGKSYTISGDNLQKMLSYGFYFFPQSSFCKTRFWSAGHHSSLLFSLKRPINKSREAKLGFKKVIQQKQVTRQAPYSVQLVR